MKIKRTLQKEVSDTVCSVFLYAPAQEESDCLSLFETKKRKKFSFLNNIDKRNFLIYNSIITICSNKITK